MPFLSPEAKNQASVTADQFDSDLLVAAVAASPTERCVKDCFIYGEEMDRVSEVLQPGDVENVQDHGRNQASRPMQ